MRKNYICPASEVVRLNTSDDVMDNPMIPVSGQTTPEESDSKRNDWNFNEEEDEK
jgi:hypothetical protein